MDRLARRGKAGSLEVDTRLAGTRMQPELRGAIQGIDVGNLRPDALARGFLEGMVRELRELVPDTVLDDLDRLVAIGNVSRCHPLVPALVREAFGRPCTTTGIEQDAAYGAGLAAAVALGHLTPRDLEPAPGPG